jgi:hypothetical protein
MIPKDKVDCYEKITGERKAKESDEFARCNSVLRRLSITIILGYKGGTSIWILK